MTHNKNSTRYFSERQEKKIADKFGGYVSANSGAADFSAGDVVLKDYLIECKTKTEECSSFSIKKEWITKIKKEAFSKGKLDGILAFNFGPNTENYFVIDEKLMEFLIEKTTELE